MNLNKQITLILIVLWCGTALAQTQGPRPQWIQEGWAPADWSGTPQTQDQSNDEWWYNHTEVFENGQHVGYAACGYAKWQGAVVTLGDQNQCFSYQYAPLAGCPSACPDCESLLTLSDHFGGIFQTIARYDLDGNMLWCKRFNTGEFFKIIQDDEENLVAIGSTKYVNNEAGDPIYYNPTPSSSGCNFSCSSGDYRQKMNVVKVDLQGATLWDHLYGERPCGSIYNERELAVGLGLAEYDDGYRLVGFTTDSFLYNGDPGYNGLMVQVNKDGEMLQKGIYRGIFNNLNGTASPDYYAIRMSDIKVSDQGDVAVSAKALYDNTVNGTTYDTYDAVAIYFPPNSFTIGSLNFFNPSTNPASADRHATSVFIEYLKDKDLFAMPVFYNDKYGGTESGDADCEMHYFSENFDPQSQVPTPAITQLGHFKAYDMKMGVTEVLGGFALISTRQTLVPSYSTVPNSVLLSRYPQGSSSECSGFFNGNLDLLRFWDSDAYVARYSITNNIVTQDWETSWDVDYKARENWPGDIKRQECLYGITQDNDGAFVVSGNTSKNFDDNYLVKIYNDNCIGLSYTESHASGTIQINSNTVWNTNKTVLGKVLITSGNTLTIDGATIEFADSKRAGVITNITVEKGAHLIVNNNAVLTVDNRCENAMWDGIRIIGEDAQAQNSTNQGVVTLGASTIEHARIGVLVGDEYHGNIVDGSGGGILNAQYTSFVNNTKSVSFIPFHNMSGSTIIANQSSMEECDFLASALLRDSDEGERQSFVFVELDQVDFVKMWSNRYRSTYTADFDLQPVGVRSFSSSLNIDKDPAAQVPDNEFERLLIGVEVNDIVPNLNSVISNSEFQSCITGITATDANQLTISRNEFYISQPSMLYQTNFTYSHHGISLKSCMNTDILFNTFNHVNAFFPLAGSGNWAIVSRNSVAGAENYVKNCIFNETSHHIQMLDNNMGLEMDCNLFDISDPHNQLSWWVISGDVKDQGICQTWDLDPAANQWVGSPSTTADRQIYVNPGQAPNIQFTYHQPSNPTYQLNPTYVTTSSVTIATCTKRLPELCPSGPGANAPESEGEGGEEGEEGEGEGEGEEGGLFRPGAPTGEEPIDMGAYAINLASSNGLFGIEKALKLAEQFGLEEEVIVQIQEIAITAGLEELLEEDGPWMYTFIDAPETEATNAYKLANNTVTQVNPELNYDFITEKTEDGSELNADALASGMMVYPNPGSDAFFIDFLPIDGSTQVQIIDPVGRIIHTQSGQMEGRTMIWDASSAKGGMYMVRITQGETQHLLRIVKQ